MYVPFVDLKPQYLALKSELDDGVLKVLSETAFIGGKRVKEFEESFADYLGVGHCVAVANGTDAIEIGLKAVGVCAGDEVLVPANTWISTAEAVTNIGGKPVFVDIDPGSYNIDPDRIEERISSRTKAIIPVHLYGLAAEMDSIIALARKYNLKILEDCAQAHGARYKGMMVGGFGDIATFSFYPSKNLGAFGDAGGIVTNDVLTAEKARLIANHGQISKNRHTLEGRNSRLDGIQAAVLLVKLPHLDSWLDARRANAAIYDELLRDSGLTLPNAPEYSEHTFHLYVVQVPKRDAVVEYLVSKKIETGLHYPTALPFMSAYAYQNHVPGDYPVAYRQMGRILSLPMFAELTPEMIEYVCRNLKDAVSVAETI